jgi:hypothetical protein
MVQIVYFKDEDTSYVQNEFVICQIVLHLFIKSLPLSIVNMTVVQYMLSNTVSNIQIQYQINII